MNKYRRAIKALYQGRTWQQVADILTKGLGDTVWPADAWNVYEGKSNSIKVETALQNLGLVSMPGPRWRLAAEWPSEERRQEFIDFYGIDKEVHTFTQWVMGQWESDLEHRANMMDLKYVEGYR